MGKTFKDSKEIGFDYSSRRPGNKGGCNSPTKDKRAKKLTHKRERRISKVMLETY